MIYRYHFHQQIIYSYTHYPAIMAGVMERLLRSVQMGPKAERRVFLRCRVDLKAQELQTAKEILREVFGTTPAEVEEMIRQRVKERDGL
jgi:hypothetical protein